jgi:hypothetical protein
LSSRGDRFHTIPDLARFKREGTAYLRYANNEISARQLIEITISPEADEEVDRQAVSQPTPAADPEAASQPTAATECTPVTQPINTTECEPVSQPTATTEPEPVSQATEVKTEVQLYDSDELYSQPAQAPAERQLQYTLGPPSNTRKRGPNRSWEDHRADQSFESSFDSSSDSEPEQGLNVDPVTEQPSISHTPVTPPRQPTQTQNLLSPTSGTVPSPLQVLFFSHSPSPNLSRLTSTPAHRSSPTGLNTASNPIPSDLADRLQNILGDVQSTTDQAVEQLSELPDATRIVPAVDNSISLPDGEDQVQQERPIPDRTRSWDSTIPATPSPEPFLYKEDTAATPSRAEEPWDTVLQLFQTVITKMEATTQLLMDRQDALDEKLTTILELLQQKQAGSDADKAKADAKVRLEAEKRTKMLELENELRTKYADAGIAADFTPFAAADDATAQRSSERAEIPKAEQVGILNPLPAHKEWTGQAVDAHGHWISFSKWLLHLEAVMAQKQSITWKRACLDVAALTCLRGRALDWWHSLQQDQQRQLREDTTLVLWDTLGKALHRNEQILKKEARDRKRMFGETLSEYAWKKLAMLQEAFGNNRTAGDVISDIKDGLTSADQEIIQSDLHKKPSIGRFMDELARLDKIRGPRYKSALSVGHRQEPYSTGTANRRFGTTQNTIKPPLSESYDPKELKMRPNPLAPGKSAQWSYKFPTGKIIYLSSPCTKCGGKHFNFECKKDNRERKAVAARAAFMFPEEPWDEATIMEAEHESFDEEDEMEVAYAAYMGIEPAEQAYGYASETISSNQRQIAAEPWSEMAQKKEN